MPPWHGIWRPTAVGLLCIIIGAGAPELAWSQSSSGGYSRPGGGYAAPSRRAPSGRSGGYSRSAYSGGGYTTGSFGDRAVSRRASSQALRDYQAARQPAPAYRRPPLTGSDGGWAAGPQRRTPALGGSGSGALTAVALWAALNSLSSPGRADYLHDHQDDPGYVQWRREADREAVRDPAVAAKLAQLDSQLAQLQSQPRNPGSTPPEPAGRPSPGGSGFIWLVLFIGIAILVLLWLWRRRMAHPPAGAAAAIPGLGGTAATRFRVGMTLPIDPSPFLLAAGLTKVQPPEGSGMTSIEAVGLLRDDDVVLHRLYLPGSKAFFQLHLGADGRPDECRYFSLLDEVSPADDQEWGLWLDPAQGMIGWPSFQTKDGKTYGRVWAPGEARIEPRKIDETRQSLERTEQRQMQAMLYGAPTGGTTPAPATEYLLVSAIEAAGQAWVEIDAGIDINPAALTLPSVPLAA